MSIAQAILPEFDHEMANTRKVIERVPDAKLDWAPHAKSGTMGWLMAHLAELPGWLTITIGHDSFDVMPPDGEPYRTPQHATVAAALAAFDANVAAGRTVLAGASDADLMGTWRLLHGGQEVFALPKVACVRSFVLNHMIHHRAQLGVYLRLNDVPVPAIYGPSADEQNMG